MTERARAFWVTAPGRGELRACTLAPPGPGEVLVRARASGVSRGTESLVFAGRVPASERTRMRCPFQEGEFPAPVKYGYASVGVVEGLGAGVPRETEGARVFALFPHQDRYLVPASAVLPVPSAVPDRRAVLAANMETAVNALWDAGPHLGDRIAVVGAGVVGALVAALAARIPGAAVEIVDLDPRRRELAAALGCGFATPETAQGERDLVFHASGAPAGLAAALGLAGFEATVVELSWYGDRAVSLPLGEAFHSRRLTLLSSQVGQVAASRRSRRSHRDRLAFALSLLADPVFDRLVTGESAFEDLPATMARLSSAPDGALCEVVRY
ncbi:MAG TPA: dehydrogenase [Stellaceae bacterium]|nr:dehydrogenase [Stellaceae bacterium]